MINDFRNISARPRAAEGCARAMDPTAANISTGVAHNPHSHSTNTHTHTHKLHSQTHIHSTRAHRHDSQRMEVGEKERASGKLLPLLFAHPSVSLFLSLFASLCCSSRRWQRFTVAHFTRLHNFNTVHKLSLLTKLLSSDVGSDVNGGSFGLFTVCWQSQGKAKGTVQ